MIGAQEGNAAMSEHAGKTALAYYPVTDEDDGFMVPAKDITSIASYVSTLEAELAKLKDPAAVRVNILRGDIAKPDDLVWLHDAVGPVAALRARLEKAEAERDAAKDELSTWRSVFPDIAPSSVTPTTETMLRAARNDALGGAADLASAHAAQCRLKLHKKRSDHDLAVFESAMSEAESIVASIRALVQS